MLTFGEQVSAAIAAPVLFVAVISTMFAIPLGLYRGLFLWRSLIVEGKIVHKSAHRNRSQMIYSFTFRFTPKKRPYEPVVEFDHILIVDQTRYDQVAEGDPVQVKYVRGHPGIVTLVGYESGWIPFGIVFVVALVCDAICLLILANYL